MIKSEIVKINKIVNFDNIYIEKELSKLGKEPLRWAVTGMEHDSLIISVSYISDWLIYINT